MSEPRLISFLPAATEIACALGLEEQLVGITHECDFPPSVQGKPVVVRSALPVERMSLREIDESVAARLRLGETLYQVDEELLRNLRPTHILTQQLCQVCAPSGNEITRVLNSLAVKPEIVWLSPHSLEDIFDNIREVGRRTQKSASAESLVEKSRARLAKLKALVETSQKRPRVLCLEWTDPYYCCGHWVPEMVALAGAQDALGKKHADSVRVTWNEIVAAQPEILVVMPCGFALEAAVRQTQEMLQQPGWSELPAVRQGNVFAVNANAYFARPGPRVVEGAELLAHLFHPEVFGWSGAANAFRRVTLNDFSALGRRTKTCSECGATFSCGPAPGNERCWCDELPPLDPNKFPGRDCLCSQCLAKAVATVADSRSAAVLSRSAHVNPQASESTEGDR